MPYDYNLVLVLPSVTQEQAMKDRAIRNNLSAYGEKPKLTEEQEARQTERSYDAFKIIDKDVPNITQGIRKNFEYGNDQWKRPDTGEVTADEETREDWIDLGVSHDELPKVEQNGRTLETLWIYRDEKPDREDHAALFLQLGNPRQQTRLTIFAHGNESSTRVGGRSPTELAGMLVRFGLPRGAQNFRISLVACCAGGQMKEGGESETSYGRDLHMMLKRIFEIKCDLSARPGIMTTKTLPNSNDWGKYVDMADDPSPDNSDFQHKAPGSKFIWSWLGDVQIWRDGYGPRI